LEFIVGPGFIATRRVRKTLLVIIIRCEVVGFGGNPEWLHSFGIVRSNAPAG